MVRYPALNIVIYLREPRSSWRQWSGKMVWAAVVIVRLPTYNHSAIPSRVPDGSLCNRLHISVTELAIRQDKFIGDKCNIHQLAFFGTPLGTSPKKFQRNSPTNHMSARHSKSNVQSIPPTPSTLAPCFLLLKGGEGMYRGRVYD